ncbi:MULTISPECIES: GNAT family N-acetyltransferase [Nocardia]|uniref:GNAT family N-acetyltransferase n=1 Tax=Nocardia jiangsuensis TaxID=1691563 RepID=A0ABV8DUG5_9NOCA|nr:N-acetyltransferase [Nocardia asteroides]UGT59126.1 N-acetyltransferase [Nocardia asteroides]
MAIEVRTNTALERFELYIDGTLAGHVAYQDTAAERAFVRSEIYASPDRGHAATLFESALRTTRAQGFEVLPMCPQVNRYIESRAEHVAAVPSWARSQFGLPL